MALWKSAALIAILLLAVRTVGTIVYRLFFHPLAKIPGPKLAAITWNYERYYDLWVGAKFWEQIGKLHEKYGPIVRINPNEVHINDPDLIDTVYPGGGKRVDKDPYLMGQFGLVTDAMFMTLNHDLWKMRRRSADRYFSKHAVNKLEPLIRRACDKFAKRLLEYRKSGPLLISAAYSSFTTDVISEYCFGECWDYLDRDRFLPNLQSASDAFGAMLPQLRAFPWIASIMRFVPNERLLKMNPGMAEWLAMEAACERYVREAKARAKGEKPSDTAYNVVDELLHSNIPEVEKEDHRLALEAQGFIGAATETTAWALSLATFHIYWNRDILKKLRHELLTEAPDKQTPSLARLETLPHLSAVITETLRHSGGPISRLPRVFPDDPVTLRSLRKTPNKEFVEYTVPPGTVLSMSSRFVHMNPELFPNPFAFLPERWLDASGKKRVREKEKYLMHFSRGTRGCIGQNLAMAELFICLATLVLQVGEDMELYQTDLRDVEPVYDSFAPRAYKDTQGIRVVVK